MALHRQHRNLIERKQKLGCAARAAEDTAGIRRERMAAKHAAEIRRARMMAQDAACRLRRLGGRYRRDPKRCKAREYEEECIRPPSPEGGGSDRRRRSGVG